MMHLKQRPTAFRLRGCPRCGGDLHIDSEDVSPLVERLEFVCIQCGRSLALRRVRRGQPEPELALARER